MTVPPAGLAPAIDQVKQLAADLDARAVAVTWRTHDGEMTVDLRCDDWLRVTFAGDGPERTYVLEPTWEGPCSAQP